MASPVVTLNTNAFLKGKIVHARNSQKPIFAFLGVPYAEPPVGHLRFKPPRPVRLWKGEKEAVKCGNVCPQNFKRTARFYTPYPMPADVSEDCLYLNVWSPSLTPSRKMPVMVWIHGGSFTQGFSNYYDGTAVCSLHDVVFVSINYRLGALGFLPSLGEEVHGNCGLLDQVEALHWIKQYIANFGGDPDNVTLFGESAGGISISLHCLSPLTKGLFHRAICQSGTALFPSIVWKNEGMKKYLAKRLKAIGCKDVTDEGMVKFLRNASAEELISGIHDGLVVLDNHYILKDPLDLYKDGNFHDVDLLLGFTSDEGFQFVLDMIQNKSITSKTQVRDLVGVMVNKMFFRGMPGADEVIEAIMNEYFGPDMTSPDMLIKAAYDVYGDCTFVMPALLTAKHHSARCRTFLYVYNHRLSLSSSPKYVTGAAHGQEIPVMIGEPFQDRFPDIWSETEKQLSKNMIGYWVNFAIAGEPNGVDLVPWHEYKDEEGNDCYLAINTHPSVDCQFSPRRQHFWNKLVPDIHQKHQMKAKY